MEINRRILLGLACVPALRAWAAENEAAVVEEGIFEAVNRERKSRGIPVLVWNQRLAQIARRHSQEMQDKKFFGHSDPSLGNIAGRLRAAGIAYRECGENLYRQYTPSGASEAAVAGWMSSDAHRSNLLKRAFIESAAGVAMDSRGRCLITQIFRG